MAVRYWNPRRAAALRIVLDAKARYQKEEFDQILGALEGEGSFEQAFGEFSRAVTAGTKEAPALFASLTGLRSSNLSVFNLVLQEISKSQGTTVRKGSGES